MINPIKPHIALWISLNVK